jgi:MFS family permease
MRRALRPLRLPGFRNLALAYLVNELGDWLGAVALAVLVFDNTGSPLATAGLFLATQFLPALLAPPIVARLEAFHGRRSLPALYAGEAAAFAALGLTATDFLLVVVVALAALDGALAASARALTRAAAGSVLRPAGMLRDGNALLNVGFTAGAAVGPAIAGLVIAGASVQVALFADAASFLAVAIVLAAARGIPRPEPETVRWRERLRDGLRYVRERPVVQRLLAAQAAAFVFFAVVIPVEVVFAKQTLDAGDGGYGALLASWGAGMVAGSVLFAALPRVSLRLLMVISTLVIGCAYLGTAAAPTLLVACLASALGGTGNGVQWVSLVSALQELIGAAYQARVLSLLESVASAMPGLGFVIGGAVTAVLSPRATYALAGGGVLAVVAASVAVFKRTAWEVEPAAPEAIPAQALAPAVNPRRAAGTTAGAEAPAGTPR